MEGVKSRRAQYAEMTRAAVLDSARELFVQRGYDTTSVDDIAKSSQVSKGAIYHHFADKKELFAQLLTDVQQQAMRAVTAAAEATDSEWERALAAAQTYLRGHVENPEARSIVRQAASVLNHDRICEIDEEVALPFIRDTLGRLGGAGMLQPLHIPTTARMILSVLVDATLQIAESDDPATAYTEVDKVLVALVSGLLRSPESA
ncbi:TetR family transcriptional regulator [Allosaccharopolyspora coralli]|uniref:TetR family transcriptional regulator n=1 Tax=Allosaccharopolyspora coralli TaxID=2665642 RepID=A0A5Q3Q264_9PSEU|nr:TetR/AcrR family transcriptional regulator [Allosaccharopolyspora coralli]QGK68433.1 TetR family transcriptional regulator [Allosaccharopolyspora coralli]